MCYNDFYGQFTLIQAAKLSITESRFIVYTCRDMSCLLLYKCSWLTVHEHSLVHVNILLNELKEYLKIRQSFIYPLSF